MRRGRGRGEKKKGTKKEKRRKQQVCKVKPSQVYCQWIILFTLVKQTLTTLIILLNVLTLLNPAKLTDPTCPTTLNNTSDPTKTNPIDCDNIIEKNLKVWPEGYEYMGVFVQQFSEWHLQGMSR